MGYSASPALLKAYVSWLKSGLLLRLLGVPAALLAVYLEVYGSSPRATSLILHRLSRRLRRSAVICMLGKDHDNDLTRIFFVGGADVMSTGAQSSPRTSNLATLDNHDRIASGGSAPRKQHHQRPSASGASDTSSSFSSATTLPHPSPSPSLSPSVEDASTTTMHSRSHSSADVMRQGKRLSLQFPIQPSTGSNSPMFSPRSRPQSWIAAPSPVPSPENLSAPETNLLAVVAAQERFVLELKEELAKAEQDLRMLKKHFATQEAMKQRNDLRKVTQLQPLNTQLANFGSDQDDEDGSNLWMQKEMERRKALLGNIKSSQRKVFSGSRHLRTLSLLSPDKPYTPSFPQPLDLPREPTNSSLATSTKFNNHLRPAPLMRNSTSPIIADQIANTVDGERYDVGGIPNVQREALIRTGKQMATDFKDGLFSFIEDIRQATVGEEPIGAEHPGSTAKGRKPSDARPTLQRASSSKKSSSSSASLASKSGGIGDDFWKEHGLSEPKASPTYKKTHAPKHHTARTPQRTHAHPDKTVEEFEDWDNWDTPAPNDKHDGGDEDDSSDESDAPSSPVSHQASSRTSTRYHAQRHDSKASTLTQFSSAGLPDDALPRDPKRNSIPWPDLVKYSPTNLKRTASHLMKEWEKNLTPPPESRDQSHPSGDYIGRALSPADGTS